MSLKPILCVDFDGVIHSYTSGWQGADVIPDPPVPGAIEFLLQAMRHFRVAIFSSRSCQPGGMRAMQEWLIHHGVTLIRKHEPALAVRNFVLNELMWPTEKPSAKVTIDDRALTFTGVFPAIEQLTSFKPWNEKLKKR